jgi:hypothetical protein
MGTTEPVRPVLGMAVWVGVVAQGGGVTAQGGVAARGGVATRGSVGTLGGVAAQGGVDTLSGVDAWGALRALCRHATGVSSSSSSSSSVKPAMTLRHFWLLSSSSMIKGPPCLWGQWSSSSGKAPLLWGASWLLSLSHGVPARLHRLVSHRWAHQRHT